MIIIGIWYSMSRESFIVDQHTALIHHPKLPEIIDSPKDHELKTLEEMLMSIAGTALQIRDTTDRAELCKSLKIQIANRDQYINTMQTLKRKHYLNIENNIAKGLNMSVEHMNHIIFESLSTC